MKIKLDKQITLLISACFITLGAIFLLGNFLFFEILYKDKFFPNTKIVGISVSGKTKAEAEELLFAKAQDWNESKTLAVGDKKSWELINKDLSVKFDTEKAIEDAYNLGRSKSFYSQVFKRAGKLLLSDDVYVSFPEAEAIENKINEIATEANTSGLNVGLAIKNNEVIETEEKIGRVVKKSLFKKTISKNIERLLSENILIPYVFVFPNTDKSRVDELKEEVDIFLGSEITLEGAGGTWQITSSDIENWITIDAEKEALIKIEKDYNSPVRFVNSFLEKTGYFNFVEEELFVTLRQDKMDELLSQVAAEIDTDAQNATLTVSGGKVVISKSDQNGRKLDINNASSKIVYALKNGLDTVELPISSVQAKVRADNIDDLGITELIAQGKSDYSGSSSTRIHNIKIGASKFDGVLVAPDEEFSFNKYLGTVDAAGGFLPELVIKPGKLVKEYGGGLCQVATTAFRAILYSGSPVTERKNHSFAVSYYVWPFPMSGTDATIYPPHPDLRFVNDTSSYILIQTYTSGNRLYFDFYGTKGATSVTLEGPSVVSRGDDGSMTTVLYRNVYNGDTLKRKDTFKSYYKPASEFERVDEPVQ